MNSQRLGWRRLGGSFPILAPAPPEPSLFLEPDEELLWHTGDRDFLLLVVATDSDRATSPSVQASRPVALMEREGERWTLLRELGVRDLDDVRASGIRWIFGTARDLPKP